MTNQQSDLEILGWLEEEYNKPFEGWNFSPLDNHKVRMGGLPWDYIDIVRRHLPGAESLLDVDTGGGEVLARILNTGTFNGRAYAIETWAPNVPVARERLRPLGVTVWDRPAAVGGPFDLVIDRHSGRYHPSELRSKLTAGGRLITQQVGEDTNRELRTLFKVAQTQWPGQPRNAKEASTAFARAGFIVERVEEHRYTERFMDAGALVYYLKAVPWEVPEFSIDKYAAELIRLYRETASRGYAIDATFHAYLVVARGP